MMDNDDYKQIIANILFEKGLISSEIYEKCSKPHLSNLPGDLRSNDVEQMEARMDYLSQKIGRYRQKIQENKKRIKEDESTIKDERERFFPKRWDEFTEALQNLGDGMWGDENDIGKQNEKVDLWREFNSTYVNGENTMDGMDVYSKLSKSLNPIFQTVNKIGEDLDKFIDGDYNKSIEGIQEQLDSFMDLCEEYKSGYDTYGLISDELLAPANTLNFKLRFIKSSLDIIDYHKTDMLRRESENDKMQNAIPEMEASIERIGEKVDSILLS